MPGVVGDTEYLLEWEVGWERDSETNITPHGYAMCTLQSACVTRMRDKFLGGTHTGKAVSRPVGKMV